MWHLPTRTGPGWWTFHLIKRSRPQKCEYYRLIMLIQYTNIILYIIYHYTASSYILTRIRTSNGLAAVITPTCPDWTGVSFVFCTVTLLNAYLIWPLLQGSQLYKLVSSKLAACVVKLCLHLNFCLEDCPLLSLLWITPHPWAVIKRFCCKCEGRHLLVFYSQYCLPFVIILLDKHDTVL